MAVAVSREGRVIHELCQLAKEHAIAISLGLPRPGFGGVFRFPLALCSNGRVIGYTAEYLRAGGRNRLRGRNTGRAADFTRLTLGKKAAVGLCGDFWYEETIAQLNDLKPDIVWWPVYTDYSASEWNRTAKREYAKASWETQRPRSLRQFRMSGSADACGAARGGAALFENGFIKRGITGRARRDFDCGSFRSYRS